MDQYIRPLALDGLLLVNVSALFSFFNLGSRSILFIVADGSPRLFI